MSTPTRTSQRLLAVITAILVIWGLKASASVTLPLAFAVFLIALFWPLQGRLERRMPQGAALLITLLTFVAVTGAFVAALWYATEMVADKAPQYEPEFRRLVERVRGWMAGLNLSMDGSAGGTAGGAQGGPGGGLRDEFVRVGKRTLAFVTGFVLVVAFFVLGLLEVRDFEEKMRQAFRGHEQRAWLGPVREIARDFQRYLVIRTGVGLVTGVGVGLFSWGVGLEFAFIWGLTNFLLNYIPTLGSIIAVVPPVLFALFQFEGWTMPLVVLLGVGGVQLVMGQYVDPRVQGNYLQLSALVVLFSVAFWGWVWGVAGAFLGIPITVGIVIACYQFERTRWIAVLLADVEDADDA